MASLKDYRDERLRKLAELRKLGVDPYPARAKRTEDIQNILIYFDKLEGKEATTVGRIVSIRSFGKIAFIVIRDDSDEQLQLFWNENANSEADRANSELLLPELNLLDAGDFIEATGKIIKTQTGEKSIEIQKLRLLAKSLRPMPGRDGFTNKEERLRRRYVDMAVNQDVRQRFIRRSKFWQANRRFLDRNGFIEINVPVLEHTTGGADAKPFKTHMDVLDQDFYLRISQELPLKKLIGGGFERVYDIGPRFRNEHYTAEHLPEHVALEWYWAYADWRDGMSFMENMFAAVVRETFGTLKFNIGNFKIDFEKEWEELDYSEVINRYYGIDPLNCTLEEVKGMLAKHQLEVAKTENKARGIDKLWKNVRKEIEGPAWLINTPLFISPLAKENPDKPGTVERFQPVIAGMELGNGYSELNDPVDQLERFKEQQRLREGGDEEAQMLDIDYVEMLEYGMPPTCGWGHSERLFWLLEGVTAREGVPFPQLRKDIDEVTRGIYPDIKFD